MSAEKNKKKIKRLDIILQEEGSTKKPIKASQVVTDADKNKEFVYNVKADLVSDGQSSIDVGKISFKFGDIPPPQPVPPVINIKDNFTVQTGKEVTIGGLVNDANGNLVDIKWAQTKGTPINFTIAQNQQSITFTPATEETLTFSVLATDSTQLTATKEISVIVKTGDVPDPDPDFDVKIAMMADTEDGKDFENTAAAVAQEKPDLVIFGGDTAYNDQSAGKWISIVDKNGLKELMQLYEGNHENGESEHDRIAAEIEKWRPDLNPNKLEEGTAKWLSTRKVKNVFSIALNSQDLDYNYQGRTQIKWCEQQLIEADGLRKSGEIDWIIVGFHKPHYTLKTDHIAEKEARRWYQPLFDKYQVDFVYHGHNHDMQLWYPMSYDAKQLFDRIAGTETFDFTKPHGQAYIINGNGGHEKTAFKSSEYDSNGKIINPNVMYADYKTFGYCVLLVKGKQATLQFKSSETATKGKVLYEAKYSKGEGDGGGTPQKKPPINIMSFSPIEPKEGEQVNVDSRKSTDPDGTITNRDWTATVTGGNQEVPLNLNSPDNDMASFIMPPNANAVSVTLTLTDNDGNTSSRTVTISKFVEKPLEAKSELLVFAKEGETVYLLGDGSTGNINHSEWIKEDTQDAEMDVTPLDYPEKKWSMKFVATAEMVDKKLPKFRLRVFDKNGNFDDATTATTITVKKKDVPNTQFPIPAAMFYNSDSALNAGNRAVASSKYVDEVLLPSGASGAKGHKIQDGWLVIDTGGGNGRAYWDFHRVNKKAIENEKNFGYAHVVTGSFVLGGDNLSIKIGNHGSDGREYDGKMVFGGFGFSLHKTEVQSKQEYWHNNQGSEVSAKYPNGITLNNTTEYKFFAALIMDKTTTTATLNIWMDFNNGKGWTIVMKDRKWTKTGWNAGSIPNGADKGEIAAGPYIKCHTVWTRANTGSSKVKDFEYGIPVI